MKSGDTRIAIIDQTEGAKLYEPIRSALLKQAATTRMNAALSRTSAESVERESEGPNGERAEKSDAEVLLSSRRSLTARARQVKTELNARIGRDELDGYLVIPPDILSNSEARPLTTDATLATLSRAARLKTGLTARFAGSD